MIAVDDIRWAVRLSAGYVVDANVPYAPANAFGRLDAYRPCENGVPFKPCTKPKPTLVFIHGGGWLDDASKESYALWFLPFLQLGWSVVNVEYRPSSVASAPAALEDCLGAMHWIARNAGTFCIDTSRLVIAGPSAGGSLALMVAAIASRRIAADAIFGRESRHTEMLEVCPAAVINWCGIVDLVELCSGEALQDFAVNWLGERSDRLMLARNLSPIRHAGEGSVPVVTVHGDDDLIVPYAQARRFHDALTRAGVMNELVTLHGSGHAFDADASLSAYPRILHFLERAGMHGQTEATLPA